MVAISSASSTLTMASAPAGTGAPVMMRTAWPVPTSPPKDRAGSDWPMTSNSRGLCGSAATVSAAHRRRAALRRWVEGARPRPDPSVIGSIEHREILAEVVARAGARNPRDPG